MGLRRRWAAWVARRRARRSRVRLTWQTCRRCGNYSPQPAKSDRLCGSCRSLH